MSLLTEDRFAAAPVRVGTERCEPEWGIAGQPWLLARKPSRVKRLFDMTLSVVGGVLALPFIGVIGLLIKLESRGPVFYGQKRIGRGGKTFTIWKFRTMIQGADRVLQRYFEQYPELQTEWKQTRKLRHDPRITPVGRWLRKTSLDELPQIWNVLRGEMSLVGPRPIIHEEIGRFGDQFLGYCQLLPGLTGLWQVSGRNNLSYEERVALDVYYAAHRSMWLDCRIVLRTFGVVFFAEGAY